MQGVAELTGFPEILDGRVKTLHPKIHGGLLARRELEEHRRQLEEHGILPFDVVAVNLYPFAATVAKPGVTLEEAIENIDIGGPTMVRAAAKNYRHVTIVVNPARYPEILQELAENGTVSPETRFHLAVEAFNHTAHYDAIIARWLAAQTEKAPLFPETLVLLTPRLKSCVMVKTPTTGGLLPEPHAAPGTVAAAKQLHKAHLNNLNDLNAAWSWFEFDKTGGRGCQIPTLRRVARPYTALPVPSRHPVSIFGGIVAFNRPRIARTAEKLNEIFWKSSWRRLTALKPWRS